MRVLDLVSDSDREKHVLALRSDNYYAPSCVQSNARNLIFIDYYRIVLTILNVLELICKGASAGIDQTGHQIGIRGKENRIPPFLGVFERVLEAIPFSLSL